MDERGCMQSVVRISTAQWCVYGITLDAECLSYWVGDVRGTPDNATLFEKRVIDTAQHKSVANSYDGANSETATDDDDGAAANSEPVIDEPANEDVAANSPPIANAVPTADDGPAKLRLDGDDIVWSDDTKWKKVKFSSAQARLITRPRTLSLVGLIWFVLRRACAAIAGKF